MAEFVVNNYMSGKVEETDYPQNYLDLAKGQEIQDFELFEVVNDLYPLACEDTTFHHIVSETVLKALRQLATDEADGVKFAVNSTGTGTQGDEPIRKSDGRLNVKAVERILGQWQVHPYRR